jgi:molecular chaperone DnaK
MKQTAPIIGIDLGTTNSAAAVVTEAGRPVMLSANGFTLVPSVVALDENGKLLVGRPARNYLPVDPNNAVRSVKRAMGTDQLFSLEGKDYTPQQISALILRQVKAVAEEALGQAVTQAVITVPAYFSDEQRTATREAGELAGLEVVRIINEPTAAALAYSTGRDIGQRVLVYDLGGGTFDVSLVQIDGSMVEVLATAGNNRLGGDDFDNRILDYIADRFKREHGVDLREDLRARTRLTLAAEEAKIRLSDHPFARIRQEFVATVEDTPRHLDEELSRERFVELIDDLLEDTMTCVGQVLRDARCRPREIDQVLLVGGSTRIPAVRARLARYFGQEPAGDINPDECVALGAAVQAAIVAGADVDSVLVDVTAHSLGIAVAEILGGRLYPNRYSVVIPRNTVIPAEKAEVYYTVHNNQQTVEIKVYQGEAPIASENQELGQFLLEGLPPRPAGEVEVVVSFNLSVDGILQVRAEERSGGKSADITVRDMRNRMSEQTKAEQEATVASLWETSAGAADAEEDVEGTSEMAIAPATQALLLKAREVAAQRSDEERDKILSLVEQIEELLQDGEEPDADELGQLEDELIDLLEE